MIETGIDIIEIDRIEAAVQRHGQRFLDRIFTENEQRQSAGRAESLAGRFAAKEAAFKVLGARYDWCDVEVRSAESGKPELQLHGDAKSKAAELGIREWSLSMSHSRRDAVAIVVARD